MSTVLINTDGGSYFQDGTDIINSGIPGTSSNDNILRNLGLSLTDADNKPVLVPTRNVIDVVNDFSWYAGPKSTSAALDKVPCAFLIEREQLLSSLVSGALYYLNATNRSIRDFASSETVTSLLGSAVGEENASSVQQSVNSTFESIRQATGGTTSDRNLLAQNNLKSLEGIYFTRPTGFQYRLPMYGNKIDLSNSPGGDQSFLQDTLDSVGGIIKTISDVVNITQPGTYIEKPQYFNNPQTVTKSISFPLANTIRRGAVSPVQQNYELLWLLAFHNKPYKTSFSRTPPPKVYSVTVPGQFSLPYAYISNMSVEFVGTTRLTSVSVPSGRGQGEIRSKVIQAPIPEAYRVTLEFSSLISDYGNSMISDAFSASIKNNTVRIGR